MIPLHYSILSPVLVSAVSVRVPRLFLCFDISHCVTVDCGHVMTLDHMWWQKISGILLTPPRPRALSFPFLDFIGLLGFCVRGHSGTDHRSFFQSQ